MSRLLQRLTPLLLKKSRLDTKFHKLTSSLLLLLPSMTDLHEIALFLFNATQVVSINENLAKNFQTIKPTSSKQLNKHLVRIQKTLAIFQYLIQVGSEDFIHDWTPDTPNYELLSELLENLELIENSNLCQDPNYTYTILSNSTRNSTRNSLSSTINKLLKLKNYLSDEEELQQFRLSFQKLRYDMLRPTPRSSIDHKSLARSNTYKGGVTGTLIELADPLDFDKLDMELMEPSVDVGNQISKRASIRGREVGSKSLDLGHLRSQRSQGELRKREQTKEFERFSNKLVIGHGARLASPLRQELQTDPDENLGTLVEVNEF